ncbi:MAG: RelA/SpoT family protein [Fidelibacterota bacterium]
MSPFPMIKKEVYSKKFRKLFGMLRHHNGQAEREFLWEAYKFSRRAHRGQLRKSGEPYFEHCYQVAKILAELNMDIITVASGLLHDVVEDTGIYMDEVKEKFGDEVAKLVDGVTKISGIRFRTLQEKQVGNIRKMLLSVAEDLRVIIIKFADRLHNMRTLDYLPPLKAKRIAYETIDVYAPLAHRLGMARIKWELEDLALKILEPEAYKDLVKKVAERRRERIRYIEKVTRPILKKLKDVGINARTVGRPKHFYSIYGKMKTRRKPFEEIYDLLAIRIIVNKVEDCYSTLGIVHSLYTPVQDRFKDFIATPKINAYQSIHTTVIGPEGKMVEIQIRTHEMERTAEDGIAAHWKYKEGLTKEDELDQHVRWLRSLIEILQSESSDPKEFMNLLKIDLFKEEIFVFTPMGDLIQLPQDSTPVDFAFAVHTDIGYHCIGAKVNGKIVPLDTPLKSGDSVEILTSDNQSPNFNWISFVKTSKARSCIKKYIRKTQYEQSVKLGREIIERELKRRNIFRISKKMRQILTASEFESIEKLFEAVGSGNITVSSLLKKILPSEKVELKRESRGETFIRIARRAARGIKVQGMNNMMITFGKCCRPVPGDSIIGFITRGKGVTIHRFNCKDIPHLMDDKDRSIDVEWDVGKDQYFFVRLKILASERKHFLKDVTESISATNTNIISVDLKVEDEIITTFLVVQVKDLKHLNRVINKISKVGGLISLERE